MTTLKLLCILFALISTCSSSCCPKLCIFDNVNCITRAGVNIYKNLVNGKKGVIKPLDPLHIKEIHGEMESVKYKLDNITLLGLKNCYVYRANLNATAIIFKQYLRCPKLISHFEFEADGNKSSPGLFGRGVATIVAYDYDILNIGNYSVFVKEDHRPHFFVKSHITKPHLKGKLVFTITKTYVVDIRRANKTELYLNNNWTATEVFLHRPIIYRAMDRVIDNLDKFVRTYTMAAIIPDN